MLSIPYLAPSGVVHLKFRCIESHDCKALHHPKYDGLAGAARLYNVLDLQKPDDVIAICEGELDTRIVSDRVGIPAVGRPGTTWHDHFPRVFADYERILLLQDHDLDKTRTNKRGETETYNPGRENVLAVAKTLPNAEIIKPPMVGDVTDWFLAEGAEAIRERMGV